MIIVFDRATGSIVRRIHGADGTSEFYKTETEDVIVQPDDVSDDRFYIDTVAHKFVNIPEPLTEFDEWDSSLHQRVTNLHLAQKRRVSQVISEYRRRKELPLMYDNKVLDTDDAAREQLMFKIFEFEERARLNQPAGVAARAWENSDGTFHTFGTDAELRNWLGGFVIALSERTAQLRVATRRHAKSIRSLTNVDAVMAYDVTAGWPVS